MSPRILVLALLGPVALLATTHDPAIETFRDITYIEGKSADLRKHQLDLYLPKDQKAFPVFVFIHGGFWSFGDRAYYRSLGNCFAAAGIAVVIPSYRLMPAHSHPAQIEDVAAAFAWTAHNIARYGGDPARIYVGGHSAGGHLAALLALDPHYLQAHGLSPASIRGVASISGVYDVRFFTQFGLTPGRQRDASPEVHVTFGAPPFLLIYCQWDYAGLGKQAKHFAAALSEAGVPVRVVRIPGKTHVTEIPSIGRAGDLTGREVADFITSAEIKHH